MLMRLGELSAYAETSMVFCRKAAEEEYSKAVMFDRETWQAMARVYARTSAQRMVEEGSSLILGYGEGDPGAVLRSLMSEPVAAAQAGLKEDRDLIAERLKGVFKIA